MVKKFVLYTAIFILMSIGIIEAYSYVSHMNKPLTSEQIQALPPEERWRIIEEKYPETAAALAELWTEQWRTFMEHPWP